MKPCARVAVFSGVALAAGWVGLAVDRMSGTDVNMQSPGAGIWIATPLLTAAALRIRKGGWNQAGLKPRLREARSAYRIALLAPAIIGFGSALAGLATGNGIVEKPPAAIVPVALSAFTINVVKNVFEEFAWRGYLSNNLTRLGLNDLRIYLISGIVWGAWHLPYYVYYLDPKVMGLVTDISRVKFGVTAVATLTGWSIAFAEMYRWSGTIWTVVLMHTIHNSFVDPIQAEGFMTMNVRSSYVFSPILGIMSVGGYIVLGLWLRKLRIQRELDEKSTCRGMHRPGLTGQL